VNLSTGKPRRGIAVTALGLGQIIAWGSSYYLPAVLAQPIARDTGWPLSWIVGGLSLALLTAGLVSPRVGRVIERRGGREVLASSALLLGLGLAGLALAPGIAAYTAAWLIIGLGMSAGLYDATFATLGRLYGRGARQAITTLTLFGGFASTACWPLSAFLVSTFGWRGACLGYAALHLLVVLPLYLSALPRQQVQSANAADTQSGDAGRLSHHGAAEKPLLLLITLAAVITMASAISTVISVHLLHMLRDRGLTLAAAVASGALVGPSQVGARAIEMLIGRYHHAIWMMVASTMLMAAGIGALAAGSPIVAPALIVYGAGLGIESIARGTLPLALFGAEGYAALMGRLAMPSLMAQAASPSLGAVLIDRFGSQATLSVLFAATVLNVVVTLGLLALSRPSRAHS
jgi:predicted MFS family arabinose efflux permease